jgi:hypothetical protein
MNQHPMRARRSIAMVVFALLIASGGSPAYGQQPGTVYQGGVSANGSESPGTVCRAQQRQAWIASLKRAVG